VRSLATAAEGYISSEAAYGDGDGGPGDVEDSAGLPSGASLQGAEVVLKVPSADFDRTLDRLTELGTVVQRHREAEDVTDKVVDVASRLKVQRASVERVRQLMGQAKSITEVVALEGELSRREADLESLEKQQQELASRTAMSTITVHLYAAVPPAAQHAKASKGVGAAVADALAAGWHALYVTVRGLLVVLAAVAPFAVVLAPVGWLAVRLWRRRRLPQPAAVGPAEEQPGS
jgi:hypothetical protein